MKSPTLVKRSDSPLRRGIGQFVLMCVLSLCAVADGLTAYGPVDLIGRGIAKTVEGELESEVEKFAKSGIFLGVTGDLKPASSVEYATGGLEIVTVRGNKGSGATWRIKVTVSVKLDVGPWAYKWAKVITVQEVVIRVLPTIVNGHLGLTGEAEVVSATAQKEENAKQRQADQLRDDVRGRLIDKLNERLKFVALQ